MSVSKIQELYAKGISPWLENHLKKTKNRSLIPIYKEYLNDSFNLYGLEPNGVSLASVMDIITGKQIFDEDDFEGTDLDRETEIIYSLIHQRFLTTEIGMKLIVFLFKIDNL